MVNIEKIIKISYEIFVTMLPINFSLLGMVEGNLKIQKSSISTDYIENQKWHALSLITNLIFAKIN